MKTKEKKALRGKSLGELTSLVKETKESLASLKLEKIQDKLKNKRSIFLKKKEIAQILSVIREKELEEESEKKNK